MKDSHIRKIMRRYLAGKASPREQAAVDTWYDSFIKSQGSARPPGEEEKEEVWKNIQHFLIQEDKQSKQTWIISPWIKVAASFVLIACAAAFFLSNNPEVLTEYLSIEQHTEAGQRATFTLSDGSTVQLNSNSSIRYSRWFTGGERRVELSGEAFFTVTRNEKQPFVVVTGDLATRVLGTSFNVKAYPELQEVAVSVATGRVAVDHAATALTVLQPDEEVVANRITGNFQFSKGVDISRRIAWQQNRLVFDNCRLEEVALRLRNDYNVAIILEDAELKSQTVTADFDSGESLQKILKVLSIVSHVNYEETNEGVILKSQTEK